MPSALTGQFSPTEVNRRSTVREEEAVSPVEISITVYERWLDPTEESSQERWMCCACTKLCEAICELKSKLENFYLSRFAAEDDKMKSKSGSV